MKEEKQKATIRLLLPFQGWCVDARGLHEHYSLSHFFTALKRRNDYNNQNTKCFCPHCDNELCGSNSYEFFRQTERGGFEYYKCQKCNNESVWDFDSFPCPIVIGKDWQNVLIH